MKRLLSLRGGLYDPTCAFGAIVTAAVVALLLSPHVANAEWFAERSVLSASQWPGDPREISVSGTKVVYSKIHSGNKDIFLYDTVTKVERRLTSNGAEQSAPAISGSRVVWQDKRNGNWDIYLYNIGSRVSKRLTTNAKDQMEPAISGNRVVWSDERNRTGEPGEVIDADIYLYDLNTKAQTAVTSGFSHDSNPEISGTKIVFRRFSGSSFHVYYRNLTQTTEHPLGNAAGDQSEPSISGNYVVWGEVRNMDYTVILYNVATERERVLTFGVSAFYPRISGTQVVYLATKGGAHALHIYDVATDDVHWVSADGGQEFGISGTRIVWSYDGLRIAEPSYPKITATIPSTVVSGVRASVTGTFKTAAGVGIPGEPVTLEASADGRAWQSVMTTATAEGGAFSLLSAPITAPRYLRVSFAQCEHYRYAKSARVMVTPQAQ